MQLDKRKWIVIHTNFHLDGSEVLSNKFVRMSSAQEAVLVILYIRLEQL
jgi:hypothetical protein